MKAARALWQEAPTNTLPILSKLPAVYGPQGFATQLRRPAGVKAPNRFAVTIDLLQRDALLPGLSDQAVLMSRIHRTACVRPDAEQRSRL